MAHLQLPHLLTITTAILVLILMPHRRRFNSLIHCPRKTSPFDHHHQTGNVLSVAASSIATTAARQRIASSGRMEKVYGVRKPKNVSVSPSTWDHFAELFQTAHMGTYAHGVDRPIRHNRALALKTFPIVTPLRWRQWEKYLSEAGLLETFNDVPIGIRNGFRLGCSSSIDHTVIAPNHKSALSIPSVINSHIEEEVALGRYSPGIPLALFEKIIGPFRTSPLGSIEKDPGSKKFRVIHDHSWPRCNPTLFSINSEIDASLFVTKYFSFTECYLYVASAPPGTQASVFDVEAAFRTIPVAPEDRLHTCIQWDNLVHIDGNVCFGLTSSGGIFGRVADAICAIFKFHNIEEFLKWVDDFIFFRRLLDSNDPLSYPYDESKIWHIANDLGFPWSPTKHIPFSSTFTFIGFEWDLINKTVQIPLKKKLKFLTKLSSWSADCWITKKTVESAIGTLNHCTLVISTGRSHLPSLYKFVASFPQDNEFLSRYPGRSCLADIAWWKEELNKPFCGCRIKSPSSPNAAKIFVDASTSFGVGFTCNGKWLAWRFLDGWPSVERNINWAEMVAIELGLRAMISAGFRSTHLLFHSDNQGVIGALNAGMSRNPAQNLILRRIILLFQEADIFLSTKWVPTGLNPADKPSRGIFPPARDRFIYNPKTPSHLEPYIVLVPP
jgi:hypothetical protein